MQSTAPFVNFINCVKNFNVAQAAYQEKAKDLEDAIEELIPVVAKYKVGERVTLKRGDAEISKIKGFLNQQKDYLNLEYYGRFVLKDGHSLNKRELRIYEWDFPEDKNDPLSR